MLRRNPDVIAIVVVVLWTLAAPLVQPAVIHRPIAGIRLILQPLRAMHRLALPSFNFHFER